jgi:hypothetical protein
VIASTTLLSTSTISILLGTVEVTVDDGIESLDLTAAALTEADPMMERSRLVSRGFVHAQFRRWETGEGNVVTVTIYEFADAIQAALSVSDVHESLRAAGAAIRTHGPATSSASLLTIDAEMTYESLVHTIAVREFHVVVATTAQPSAFSWESVRDIADAQADRF